MGKKIENNHGILSPKKNFISDKPSMPSNQPNNILNNLNPTSNDLKMSKKQGQAGSGQTSDNHQVEEERRQTIVTEFDPLMMPLESGQSSRIVPPCGSGFPNDGNSGDDSNGENSSGTPKKDNEYVKFFKFYYEKTKNEHQNWTPSQITQIVSLLWKKKKTIQKAPSQEGSTTTRRSNKPLTAKDAFRMKHKELSKEQVDDLWSKLPKESKNFWKNEGNSYCTVSAKSSDVSSIENCKNSIPIYNSMRALLNHF